MKVLSYMQLYTTNIYIANFTADWSIAPTKALRKTSQKTSQNHVSEKRPTSVPPGHEIRPLSPLVLLWSCCTCCGRPLSQVRAVGVAVVKLKGGDSEVPTRLVGYKLHIPTIKDFFGLSSVSVDGKAEPADDRGPVFTSYLTRTLADICYSYCWFVYSS